MISINVALFGLYDIAILAMMRIKPLGQVMTKLSWYCDALSPMTRNKGIIALVKSDPMLFVLPAGYVFVNVALHECGHYMVAKCLGWKDIRGVDVVQYTTVFSTGKEKGWG